MEEKMDEENSFNENNRKISGPFGNPSNWYTNNTAVSEDLSHTSSSSNVIAEGLTEFEGGNFTVELMIVAHGEMKTEDEIEHGAQEIDVFDSFTNVCMFMFAPIGYICWTSPRKVGYYKENLINNLNSDRHQIDQETFGKMIVDVEKQLSGKKYSEIDNINIKNAKQHRSHTMYCNTRQNNKYYKFYDTKNNFYFGVFILKTIRFKNGFTIEANTNLLDLDVFKQFMRENYNIRIQPAIEGIYGYDIYLPGDTSLDYLLLSEIVSFFEWLNEEGKEISALNIFDIACNTIFDPRNARRLSRSKHEHENVEFGGKKINLRYLPRRLTRKDKKKQINMLLKSRRLYKKGQYYTRKNVKSFKSKKSKHIIKAEKIYNVDKIGATNELAKKTGCSKNALAKIINKGEGAYFSSGSRPNQTGQSWGIARLASAITSGKAAAVDYNILEKGCRPNSKALKMAKKSKKKYGHGTRRVPKVKI